MVNAIEDDPEVIRRQMEQTRESLAGKLESLEQHVVGTVQDTTNAVTETTEKVTDAVGDTVDAVKDTMESIRQTFDLRLQVERHPWAMLGGSVALGYVIGSILPRSGSASNGNGQAAALAPAYREPARAPEPKTSYLGKLLAPELDKVKALALGALVGVVRDGITQALPNSLEQSVRDVMNRITNKLGGEPVAGPVLADEGTPR